MTASVEGRYETRQSVLSDTHTWRPRGLSKWVISRVIIRVTPFKVLITLLITHLLSPLGLQVLRVRQARARVGNGNPDLKFSFGLKAHRLYSKKGSTNAVPRMYAYT